jgi:hypothetical protein
VVSKFVVNLFLSLDLTMERLVDVCSSLTLPIMQQMANFARQFKKLRRTTSQKVVST